jgi:RNA polymerase sigma-70 factor (ECF subfamily)
MSDPWDGSQLVDRLRNKDEAAFAILVRRFQARLYGLAFAMTLDREESRDIVQEVFLKAYRSIGTFRGESKLSTWLHRITVNQCLNWKRRWLRRLQRHRPLVEEGDEPSAVNLSDVRTPEAWLREKQLRRRYRQALQALPDKARAVYVLKELEGRSYEEIAATLRLNRGTVSSRLHYARKQLQAALGDFQDGDGS